MKIVYSGDNHITLDTPVCRTDDFKETLINKLSWLKSIIEKYDAVFINGGDIGDVASYKSNIKTLEWVNFMIANYPECYTIFGNHDEPSHRIDYMYKSLLSPLIEANICKPLNTPIEITKNVFIHGFHFGQEISSFDESLYSEDSKHIAIFHGYVYKEKTSLIDGYNAKQLLYDNPQYDMILTADHHTNFVETLDDQILINSGPLYRGTIKQIDYEPVVYLVETDTLAYEAIPVPIVDGIISTEHKDVIEYKRNVMESVVNTVKSNGKVSLSFKNELKAIMEENKKLVDADVKEYISMVTEEGESYVR